MQSKNWATLAVVIFCGITQIATTGACIYLAANKLDIPANLQSIAVGSFMGMIGLLKSTHGEDPTISEEQMNAVSDRVVKAMSAKAQTVKDQG